MPSFDDRMYAICQRYKICSDGEVTINRWAMERELCSGVRSRSFQQAMLYDVGSIVNAGAEQLVNTIRAGFEQLLDVICKQYEISSAARKAILNWADERELLAGSSVRSNALRNAGIYVTKPVLRAGLKAVDPAKPWTVSALHLEYYGHQIITGSDEAKKAKFIAACAKADPYGR